MAAEELYVHGLPASDLEWNMAAGLSANDLEYTFQYEVETAMTVPGEERVVDFMVWYGIGYPIEVDADFTHKTAEQREDDRVRDALIDEALAKQGGFAPLRRITETYVATVEAATLTAREII